MRKEIMFKNINLHHPCNDWHFLFYYVLIIVIMIIITMPLSFIITIHPYHHHHHHHHYAAIMSCCRPTIVKFYWHLNRLLHSWLNLVSLGIPNGWLSGKNTECYCCGIIPFGFCCYDRSTLDQQQPVGHWAATRQAVGPPVELKHEPVKAWTHDAI